MNRIRITFPDHPTVPTLTVDIRRLDSDLILDHLNHHGATCRETCISPRVEYQTWDDTWHPVNITKEEEQ